MNDKIFLEKLERTRFDINRLIDNLVKEALETFSTYDEAVEAIRKEKFFLWGSTGELIIREAINKIEKIALKKPTKN
jgi:hypothetical protein